MRIERTAADFSYHVVGSEAFRIWPHPGALVRIVVHPRRLPSRYIVGGTILRLPNKGAFVAASPNRVAPISVGGKRKRPELGVFAEGADSALPRVGQKTDLL